MQNQSHNGNYVLHMRQVIAISKPHHCHVRTMLKIIFFKKKKFFPSTLSSLIFEIFFSLSLQWMYYVPSLLEIFLVLAWLSLIFINDFFIFNINIFYHFYQFHLRKFSCILYQCLLMWDCNKYGPPFEFLPMFCSLCYLRTNKSTEN